MPEKRQNDNIGHLGNTWLNEVKNIRAMAKQQHEDGAKNSDEAPVAEDAVLAPSDEELFAGQVCEELTPQQLFNGDEDFYKSLKSSKPPLISIPSPAESIPTFIAMSKRFSFMQNIIAAAILLIAAIILYAFLIPTAAPLANKIPDADKQITVAPEKTPTPEPSATKTIVAQNVPAPQKKLKDQNKNST